MELDRERRQAGSASSVTWLSDLGTDAAKLGIILYLLGLLSSSFYYSRFSILTLDFTKTQSILIGVYVVFLYAAVPAVAMFVLKGMGATKSILPVFCAWLGLVNTVFALILKFSWANLVLAVIVTAVLQFSLYCYFTAVWNSVKSRKLNITFVLRPPRAKAGVLALLCCAHFAMVWFPRIPAYFGGGQPLRVQIFAKTPELPANRFVDSKNRPQINKSLDSYSLQLLYETDKDIYFLYDLQTGDTLIGYSVMRLKKDEVLRIDYMTPKWFGWEGGQ
jgi:hypothetical protein